MTRHPILMAAVLLLPLGGCSRNPETPQPPAAAVVNGQPISQALFTTYVHEKTGVTPDKLDPKRKDVLLHELAQLKAAAIAAEAGVDPSTQAALELQRVEALARAGATAAGVFSSPTDAELRAEYDAFTASLPAKEYHVAHILVATESQAQTLLTRLEGGADFGQVAAIESADDSKIKGGDLGWISPGKLPAELTDAVRDLKPGQLAPRPVHTIYGWHVIKLLETRPTAAPPFDQVRAQLIVNLQQARYQHFLDAAAARVETVASNQ